jgi:hypothetical protein
LIETIDWIIFKILFFLNIFSDIKE